MTLSGVQPKTSGSRTPSASGRFTLVVAGDDGSERVMTFADRHIRIGRSSDNDVVLPDADKGVSRAHAELRREGELYVIVDLESQNGTWVNGERVQRAIVPPGAEMAIGLYRLRLQQDAPVRLADLPLHLPERTLMVAASSLIPREEHVRAEPVTARGGLERPARLAAGVAVGVLALVLGRMFLFTAPSHPLAEAPPATLQNNPARPVTVEESEPRQVVEPLSTAGAEHALASASPTIALPELPLQEQGDVPAAPRASTASPVRRAARDAFDAGNRLDVAGDWLGALQRYDQARQLDASLPGLERMVKQVWEKMRVAGRESLNHAREYDSIGQSADALKEYDKAAQWLPPDDPNRERARSRADQLRHGVK